MDFEKIKNLMQSLDNSNLMDFELKLSDGFYLRMNKYNSQPIVQNNITPSIDNNTAINTPTINNIAENISEPITIIPEIKQEIKEGNIVASPIVGTFYSSSSPTKPAYVKVGDKVKQGDILCTLYSNDNKNIENAKNKIKKSIVISNEKPKSVPLVFARVEKNKIQKF